ncbi:Oxoglutarate/iron-dependent dioxygenase [Parasponia andersonii]|uniref:Oxoglutarate/iron-dependent dioxygenase n=1 Tax=Parasponia andersonii TaxID=3476 RepID=A0A2P5BK87_PARAD|nr:Oxoglutarate/iron-dependent dioxygenase [Parasponia andersonii]
MATFNPGKMELRYMYTLMILATIQIQWDRFEVERLLESSPVTEKPKWVKLASMAFPGGTGGSGERRATAELHGSSASRRRSVGGPDGGWQRFCGGAAEREKRGERKRVSGREREKERGDWLSRATEACEEFAQEAQKLCTKLMELIALSLGLPTQRFSGFFKDQTTSLKLNHYPPCPIPNLALGLGRHKDSGILTVLAQDDHVGGLQVKRKTDGEWILVKPTPDAYVINVGQIIQVWSNDRYESVEHRVIVNSEKERFSIPFFFRPAYYTMVKPLEELIDEQNPAKYRAYNWGKFYTTRKGSNFRKLDVENIQMEHFRVTK